jgi:proteasome beta subunit
VPADGIVLASDRRASKGGMVGSKAVKKIYLLDSNKAVAIAGQLSDANYLINLVKAESKLMEFERGFPLTVKESAKLLSNILYSGMRSYAPFITEMLVAGMDDMLRRVIGEDIELITKPEPALGCVRPARAAKKRRPSTTVPQ